MPTIVADCPRCGALHMTFDVLGDTYVGMRHGWKTLHEVSVICRRCKRLSVLKIGISRSVDKGEFLDGGKISKLAGDLEPRFTKEGFVDVSDLAGVAEPPEHLPDNITSAFLEGAKCMSVGCYNAAAAMFRLCLDLTTKPLLPDPKEVGVPQPDKRQRYNLDARIEWLMMQGGIPGALAGFARAIRQHGNDGAHDGSLDENDAADLLDFTTALLERQFTEPERLRLADERRAERRAPKA